MYNILFTFTSLKTEDSTATLMATVNATLTAAVSSVGGGASAFSVMLTLQFLNVTDAAGSIVANIFSGVTTPAPTVSRAVVTATTQAPVSAPTLAPVTAALYSIQSEKASGLSQTSQIIIGVVVGVGSALSIVVGAVCYSRRTIPRHGN